MKMISILKFKYKLFNLGHPYDNKECRISIIEYKWVNALEKAHLMCDIIGFKNVRGIDSKVIGRGKW